MNICRIGLAALLTLSISGAPALAGDLADSVTAAATAAGTADPQETPMRTTAGSGRAMFWGGTALFAGGMAYGLFEFINNRNGSYAEFGEATATNKKAGAAGLSAAFAGGVLMLLGKHARALPALTFQPRGVGLAKQLSW